eukprot:scaffold177305_cov51-Prasinocladus_malaysianus.AAC.3
MSLQQPAWSSSMKVAVSVLSSSKKNPELGVGVIGAGYLVFKAQHPGPRCFKGSVEFPERNINGTPGKYEAVVLDGLSEINLAPTPITHLLDRPMARSELGRSAKVIYSQAAFEFATPRAHTSAVALTVDLIISILTSLFLVITDRDPYTSRIGLEALIDGPTLPPIQAAARNWQPRPLPCVRGPCMPALHCIWTHENVRPCSARAHQYSYVHYSYVCAHAGSLAVQDEA